MSTFAHQLFKIPELRGRKTPKKPRLLNPVPATESRKKNCLLWEFVSSDHCGFSNTDASSRVSHELSDIEYERCVVARET